MKEEFKEVLLTNIKKIKECWVWQRAKRVGYGTFKRNKKNYATHRVSFELFVGPIPEGMFVCHKCDNPACINPKHLFLGTHTDNMQDSLKKGRFVRQEGTPFKAGHIPTNKVISDDVVKEIKQLLKEDHSVNKIAKQFNTNRYFISDIKRGKTYSHL